MTEDCVESLLSQGDVKNKLNENFSSNLENTKKQKSGTSLYQLVKQIASHPTP